MKPYDGPARVTDPYRPVADISLLLLLGLGSSEVLADWHFNRQLRSKEEVDLLAKPTQATARPASGAYHGGTR